jgi:hypothetical protein
LKGDHGIGADGAKDARLIVAAMTMGLWVWAPDALILDF